MRTHIGIPLIVIAYAYFNQVVTDVFTTALHYFFKQVEDLLGFKSALYRCAGIGAQFRIKSVNIKAE